MNDSEIKELKLRRRHWASTSRQKQRTEQTHDVRAAWTVDNKC